MGEIDHGPMRDLYHEEELGGTWVKCQGCSAFRVHDFHYFYCRKIGDQAKLDMDPYNGGLKRLMDIVFNREAGELAPCEDR